MGKVRSEEDSAEGMRQKKKLKCKKSKYLKPALLARYSSCKAMIAKPYAELENERKPLLNDEMVKCALESDLIVKPSAMANSPITEKMEENQYSALVKTPTALLVSNEPSESMLESLPMDIMVKIVCHLHHDELKPAFHVSQRLRKAIHFNYKTPIRSRQELMGMHTPVTKEHSPFQSQGRLNFVRVSSPRTPKAPKPVPRPCLKYTDLSHTAAVLFPETSLSSRYIVPPVLQRTPCKAVASHRVLFYEEELCQAVAQNKLR